MKTAECRGCKKQIVFAKDRGSGKTIPLDPVPPVYRVAEDGSCCRVDRQHMVSHFATCSNADQFHGENKK